MFEKLNCYVAKVSIFSIAVALIAGMMGCIGGGYTPPSEDLQIWDWYDLDAVRNNLRGHHILMNDLDSTTAGYEELASPTANQGKGWQPIGTPLPPPMYGEFAGIFDGQGYEIRDLFVNRPDEGYVGLFGAVDRGGVTKDIGVVNVTVIGEVRVGGLVGENFGTMKDSYFTGNVTGLWAVGGLVGYNWGAVVSNSYYNYDKVLIRGENIITLGALFDGDFEEWLANGKFLDVNERLSQENGYYLMNDVSDFKQLLAFGQNATLKFRLTNDLDLGADPNFYIPYLAGEFDGNGHKISNLTFNFDFFCNVGLFGYLASGGTITQVGVENVNITGDEHVGGLVGLNFGTVSSSYSAGSVTGDWDIGGLVGRNYEGTVSNSYSSASVTGNNYVGGLTGDNGGTVSNSYSTGNVTGKYFVGGLVGRNYHGTVSNSFWDIETSGQSTSAGGTGKTTAEMQDITTFSGVAWNITAVAFNETNPSYIWNIIDKQTYPFLSWEL